MKTTKRRVPRYRQGEALMHGARFEILAQLDAGCRRFLTLHFIHGLAYEEIGEIVRKSYDAVRMAITRCLEEARDQFEP